MGRPVPTVRTRHISAPVPRNASEPLAVYAGHGAHRHHRRGAEEGLIERNGFPAAAHRLGADRHRRGALPPRRPRRGARAASTCRATASWSASSPRCAAGRASLPDRGAAASKRTWSIVGDGPKRAVLEDLVVKNELASREWCSPATRRTWCRGCRRSTSSRCPRTPTRACRRRWCRRCSPACLASTTDVGGIPEAAIHEKTALVVPAARSPSASRDAIQRLLSDPALARRLGDEARRHCAANFSYQRMLDRMEEIYLQVLR